MARILITGGAGYVGSHCAKAAAMAGHECNVFDSLIFGHRDFVRWGPLIEGDVRDAAALEAVFARQRIDAVMHFAALAYVGESVAESAPHQPINPYGFTKLVCERMMDDFGAAHGLRSVRLRYFNAAGADADG